MGKGSWKLPGPRELGTPLSRSPANDAEGTQAVSGPVFLATQTPQPWAGVGPKEGTTAGPSEVSLLILSKCETASATSGDHHQRRFCVLRNDTSKQRLFKS